MFLFNKKFKWYVYGGGGAMSRTKATCYYHDCISMHYACISENVKVLMQLCKKASY